MDNSIFVRELGLLVWGYYVLQNIFLAIFCPQSVWGISLRIRGIHIVGDFSYLCNCPVFLQYPQVVFSRFRQLSSMGLQFNLFYHFKTILLSWHGKKDWIGVPYRELSEPRKNLRILQEDGTITKIEKSPTIWMPRIRSEMPKQLWTKNTKKIFSIFVIVPSSCNVRKFFLGSDSSLYGTPIQSFLPFQDNTLSDIVRVNKCNTLDVFPL